MIDSLQLLAIGMPGMWEWVVILVVALVIFGRRLPNVLRTIGGGVREFRKGVDGVTGEIDKAVSGNSESQEIQLSLPPEPKADGTGKAVEQAELPEVQDGPGAVQKPVVTGEDKS